QTGKRSVRNRSPREGYGALHCPPSSPSLFSPSPLVLFPARSRPRPNGQPAEEFAGERGEEEEDEMAREDKFPVWEAALLAAALGGVYVSMPHSDYSFLKLPRNLQDLRVLTNHLEGYTSDYTIQVLVGYCAVYIFMQTFMIPGTIFMSLLAGALFGQLGGLALVIFAATSGASSCYFLSKLVGKPLVLSLWPDKLMFFQKQVAKRRERLLNYMLFLRATPTLPNTFINFASPIVDVPYHIFFLATSIGLIPASYVTVRAGITLSDLRSLNDLYDPKSIAVLFLIGLVSVMPTLLGKNETQGRAPADMAASTN
ncbi:unnamed protein product, partial [Urochloa humidicola]